MFLWADGFCLLAITRLTRTPAVSWGDGLFLDEVVSSWGDGLFLEEVVSSWGDGLFLEEVVFSWGGNLLPMISRNVCQSIYIEKKTCRKHCRLRVMSVCSDNSFHMNSFDNWQENVHLCSNWFDRCEETIENIFHLHRRKFSAFSEVILCSLHWTLFQCQLTSSCAEKVRSGQLIFLVFNLVVSVYKNVMLSALFSK